MYSSSSTEHRLSSELSVEDSSVERAVVSTVANQCLFENMPKFTHDEDMVHMTLYAAVKLHHAISDTKKATHNAGALAVETAMQLGALNFALQVICQKSYMKWYLMGSVAVSVESDGIGQEVDEELISKNTSVILASFENLCSSLNDFFKSTKRELHVADKQDVKACIYILKIISHIGKLSSLRKLFAESKEPILSYKFCDLGKACSICNNIIKRLQEDEKILLNDFTTCCISALTKYKLEDSTTLATLEECHNGVCSKTIVLLRALEDYHANTTLSSEDITLSKEISATRKLVEYVSSMSRHIKARESETGIFDSSKELALSTESCVSQIVEITCQSVCNCNAVEKVAIAGRKVKRSLRSLLAALNDCENEYSSSSIDKSASVVSTDVSAQYFNETHITDFVTEPPCLSQSRNIPENTDDAQIIALLKENEYYGSIYNKEYDIEPPKRVKKPCHGCGKENKFIEPNTEDKPRATDAFHKNTSNHCHKSENCTNLRSLRVTVSPVKNIDKSKLNRSTSGTTNITVTASCGLKKKSDLHYKDSVDNTKEPITSVSLSTGVSPTKVLNNTYDSNYQAQGKKVRFQLSEQRTNINLSSHNADVQPDTVTDI